MLSKAELLCVYVCVCLITVYNPERAEEIVMSTRDKRIYYNNLSYYHRRFINILYATCR